MLSVPEMVQPVMNGPENARPVALADSCAVSVGTNLSAMYFLDKAQEKLVADYAAKLPGVILGVVDDAKKKRLAARIESGRGHAGFAVNRRNNKQEDVPKLRQFGKLQLEEGQTA